MKPLLEVTVGELLKESTKKFGHQEAVIYSEQNIRYTYAEFYQETSRVAKALLATGLKKAIISLSGLQMCRNGYFCNSQQLE